MADKEEHHAIDSTPPEPGEDARRRQRHDNQIQMAQQQFEEARRRSPQLNDANRPSSLDDSRIADWLRESLPGYEIGEEIHRGGQGVVYRSVQQGTDRNVAIKVMREGPFAGAREKARFDREVQILGQLKHPNIVTVYDSGSSAGGFYFVMDYIRGIPLDRWAAEKELSLSESLKLFKKVCEAVNVAHLRGVIHRDLKPANILVDSAGEPHILDFGLAKVSEFDVIANSQSLAHTATGQFVGSLPWAAPEQVESTSRGIDIRCDVYALGVIFYQLLTGCFPYPVVGNIREILDNICTKDPVRPSSLNSAVNDEVETLVLKCLQKRPEDRYQGAGELAREIDRYLRGEAIEAKRASSWYVLKKAIRRNPFRAATVGLVLLLVVHSIIALVFVNLQERRLRSDAEEARGEAQRQAAIATAVVEFLTEDVLEAVDPFENDSRDLTAQAMFDQAVAKIDGGAFTDQPMVEAELRLTLGAVYRSIWEVEAAEAQLLKARTLFARELGEDHEKTLKTQQHLAWVLTETSKFREAEALLRQTGDTQERVLGADHAATLTTRNDLAALLLETGRAEESEALYKDLLDRRLVTDGPEDNNTLNAINNYATAMKLRGKLKESEPLFRQALEVQARVMGDGHPDTLSTIMNLADVVIAQGRIKEAEPLARQALTGLRGVLGDEHGRTILAALVLGKVLNAGDQLGEAEEVLVRAWHSSQQSVYSDNRAVQLVSLLARVLSRQGKLAAAAARLQEGLAFEERLNGESTDISIWLRGNLGYVYIELGELGNAEQQFTKALALSRGMYGPEHPSTLSTINNLASLYLKDDPSKAEPLLREALSVHGRLFPDKPADRIVYKHNLAMSLHGQEEMDEAEALYREVLQDRGGQANSSRDSVLATLNGLANLLEEQERYEEAEPMFRQIVKTAEELWPAGHYLTETYRTGLGGCLVGLKRFEEAEELLLISHERLERTFPPDHRYRLGHVKGMIKLYEAWGKPEEAAVWKARLAEHEPASPA